jgi:hypothetical protein
MSREDDRRATDRFVAGLPVEPDALTEAITARAVDRTVVIEALLSGLADGAAAVRRRTATRIGRMPDVDPEVAARLTVIAGTDGDADVQAEAVAALRTHGLPVPGDRAPTAEQHRAPRRSFMSVLLLRASVARSGDFPVEIQARYDPDAPEIEVTSVREAPAELRLDLTGLPPTLAGTEPVLRGRVVPAPAPLTALGTATGPVSDDGRVTIRVPLEVTSIAEVTSRLLREADLALPGE